MKPYQIKDNTVVKAINGKKMCEFENVSICEGTVVFTDHGRVVLALNATDVDLPTTTAPTEKPARKATSPKRVAHIQD